MTIRSTGRIARVADVRRGLTCACDALERRLLLAATAVRINSRGTLIVAGDARDNQIVIRTEKDVVVVQRDAETVRFPFARVKRVRVDGGAGNDLINNDTGKRRRTFGGLGADWMLGGRGSDRLIGDAEHAADSAADTLDGGPG